VTWVKFCGCTGWPDVAMAIDAGADAVGFIFARSPRRVAIEALRDLAPRLPQGLEAVGVFVDPAPEELDAALALLPGMSVQFSGNESPDLVARYGERAIKAIHVDAETTPDELALACARYPGARVLFDTKAAGLAGGTGRTFDWQRVAPIASTRSVVIAGGLDPSNVAACVLAVRPFGVDVRSGVESHGRKDPQKMQAFRQAVRDADAA
jgi:phosphoribosylanthranilate isomerase